MKLGPCSLDLCSGCSGLWFAREKLQALSAGATNEQLTDDLNELVGALYKGNERTGKVYLSCPVCRELMPRKIYSTDSGVQVCRCETHGTYVDRMAASRLVRLMRGEGDAELRALDKSGANDGELDARARVQMALSLFGFV